MDEETPSKDRLLVRLPEEEEEDAKALERALQWPEDLPKWDQLNTPTKLDEMSYMFN